MKYKRISFETKDNIAYVGFGHNSEKSMAVLDKETLEELKEIVLELKSINDLKGAIFHSHLKGCFLAGADIQLISSLKTESDAADGARLGQEIYNNIEDLKVPTIACIDGVCLGGGLELVLACSTILASDSNKTTFALPEVKLGLLPGFGGTWRLPLRVGLPNSLDMILTGKNVKAKKAKRMKLVDEVYASERLLEMALRHIKKKQGRTTTFKEKLSGAAIDNFVTRKIIFQKARETVIKKTKGFYHAPLKILDVMEGCATKNRAKYLTKEALGFGELCVSLQSQNLRHIFFMMERAKKFDVNDDSKSGIKVNRGAVLGAGTMGGGIAWLMADNGMHPHLKDINIDALELGLKQSSSIFKKALKRRRISKDEFIRKQRSIYPQLNFDGFKRCDLVIEAVVEDLEIKRKVFSELEKEVSVDCIIASNTSALSVTKMAEAFEKPERFAGLHFFNPVNMMPLIEIIAHENTSRDVLKALHEWCLKVKKTPVLVKDGPGFLVNRILAPFLNEASYLLAEGVSIKDIDRAGINFGMPMGACRLFDEVGLDVGHHASQVLYKDLGSIMKPSDFIENLVAKGFLGKKNNKAFYIYDEKGKAGEINSEIEKHLPSKTKKMSEVDIQKRLILPMINQAAEILKEGIVEDAMLVDLGLVFGIGFPPFRGGLLKYADHEGLDNILGGLNELSEKICKERFMPSSYLKDLVKQKKKFYE